LAVPCPPGADSPLRSQADIQAYWAIKACGLTLLKTVTLITEGDSL
jgi:hypothetical protein